MLEVNSTLFHLITDSNLRHKEHKGSETLLKPKEDTSFLIHGLYFEQGVQCHGRGPFGTWSGWGLNLQPSGGQQLYQHQ